MRSPRWTGRARGSPTGWARCSARPAPASFEPLVTALINELAGRPDGDEVLLVLDDYHLIGAAAGARLG